MGKPEFLFFNCGVCRHPIKAPAASEGRVGRCPNCRLPVVAPAVDSFDIEYANQPGLRPVRLREMLHGAAVSVAFHVLLMSAAALVIVKSPELGRTLLATLYHDTEGTEIELDVEPVETATINLAPYEGDPSFGLEGLSGSDDPVGPIGRVGAGSGRQTSSGRGTGGTGGTGRTIQVAGSIDPVARFSATAMERLARQPAARRGDYEIALFWDGTSDLDLHVHYYSGPDSSVVTRTINYSNRGKPETGFLDVDQNAATPLVKDPIEHVRWNTKSPPSGFYQINVHGYTLRDLDPAAPPLVPFTVEIKTPEGVRSHSGVVGQKGSVEIETLAIEIPPDKAAEQAAEHDFASARRLLDSAKKKLESKSRGAKSSAKSILKNIERKYPSTSAAAEAKVLLNSIAEN